MFYELAYITPATLKQEEQSEIKAKVNAIIQEYDGKIIIEPAAEKRKLSYIIKRTRQGVFQYVRFSIDKENVAKINENLRLISEILRNHIIRLDSASPNEASKTAQKMTPQTSAKKIKEKQYTTHTEVKKEEKKEEMKKAAEDKSKISLDKLDEKIDEILKEEIIK